MIEHKDRACELCGKECRLWSFEGMNICNECIAKLDRSDTQAMSTFPTNQSNDGLIYETY